MDSPIAFAAESSPFELSRLCEYFSECSPRPMLALDGPSHIVRYANPAFARLAGNPVSDIVGRSFAEAMPEQEWNECRERLNRVYHTGHSEALAEQEHTHAPLTFWSYEMWPILAADEKPIGVMLQVTDSTESVTFQREVRAMNEALVLSSVRQHELIEAIQRGERERHELELRMFQAQKSESLGVLAGGIAHDLNNLLTPVLGYAELAEVTLPKDSPVRSMLEEVSTNARRAAELVQQVLAFAGQGSIAIQSIDLTSLIRGMSGLLGSSIRPSSHLVYELTEPMPPVDGDRTQLIQIVLNLVVNASEAIGDTGGAITIRTGLVPADHRSKTSAETGSDTLVDWPNGSCIFVEVSDTGCGMPPDVIPKIFDPFFTTKFLGRGLGLAVVQGVVRVHHGVIQVDSEPGRGSTFRIILPVSSSTVAGTTPSSIASSATRPS